VDDISVLVVDDQVVFAEAVQARLCREPDLRPVWVAYTAEQARHRISTQRPMVVVLDERLGDASGLDLAERVRQVAPQSSVVMLSATEPVESVVRALRCGARAWLPKTVDADRLVRVIRGVTRGEAWIAPDLLGRVLADLVTSIEVPPPDPLAGLTPREREVLQRIVDGLSRAQIAADLHLSVNTVRTHVQNLLGKVGAHSTLEMVALARRHGPGVSDS
jgi:DNA-binding NarL/FixJ family response regulator